jgi:hypothetical protein
MHWSACLRAPIKLWRCYAKIIIFNKSEKCDQLESNLPPSDVLRKNYHSFIDQFIKSKKCNQLESNRPLCGLQSKSPALYCSTAVRRIYFYERQFFWDPQGTTGLNVAEIATNGNRTPTVRERARTATQQTRLF